VALPEPTDPWAPLRALTPARIGLGAAGASQPTRAQLAFQLAHARARDAVHHAFDPGSLLHALAAASRPTIVVASEAADRATYLRRPDLGRCLAAESRARLDALRHDTGDRWDAAFVVADGLSALAVERHALPLLERMLARTGAAGWRIAPIIIAHQARVALGDEIGAALGLPLIAVLIGERPGLSSPDSLGIYLTWEPRPGRSDAERNCISNVRPDGLNADAAAARLWYLMREARRRQLTGIALKDESAMARLKE
jgi:ethanolamine ammonia-lyase small subunit